MTKLNKQHPDDYLANLFSKHDRVYLGDELKEKLVKNFGKTNVAARKIVERFVEKGMIQSSSPVSFGRGTFAYYSLHKKITYDDLLGITRVGRPPLFRLLTAIKKCGGILSYYEALKITSAPLIKSKTKTIGLDVLISELMFFKAITQSTDKNNVKYLIANFIEPLQVEAMMARHYSLMLVDACLIYDVIVSLSKLNLIDNRYIRYRERRMPSKGQEHNNFAWDAFAYTKTTGINTVYGKKKSNTVKQALVVIDMVISRKYELFDYEGFHDRIKVLLNNTKNERKIIPIVVYREMSTEALNKARGFGMLTYDISAFFGNAIYEVIDNVKVIKLNENGSVDPTVDIFQTIADTLEIIDETGNLYNLQNMTGDFFQSLMYQLFQHLYPNSSIEQGKKLPAMDDTIGRKKQYEYDLVINSPYSSEVIAIELKGSRNNATVQLGDFDKKNSLKWFFERTFPSFQKHFASALYSSTKVRGVFITSGKFDKEGVNYLSSLNKGKNKPESINVFYDGKQLRQLVNQNSLYVLQTTLERYFIVDD